MTATASQVLATAAAEIGTTESPAGSNRVPYWSVKPSWNGGPWCAAFIQWCLKKHGMWYDAALPFYCPSLVQKAKAEGRWIGATGTPAPGDLVIYGTTGYAHVGFVVRTLSLGRIETIEGNTSSGVLGSQSNGDGVYRRTRTRSWVRGFIRMSYAPASSAPAPKPAPAPAPKPASTALVVDGKLGPATIKRWQRVMGTEVDGEISRPSELVRAVQRHLRSKGHNLVIDGLGIQSNATKDYGPTRTVKALQKYLGTEVDGVLSAPSSSAVKALQRRLNTGRF
jgi:hypothetical protein